MRFTVGSGPAAVIRRLLLPKNKLLVVVGAGASIDFGMPSVEGVADLLSEAAQDRYPLRFCTLYLPWLRLFRQGDLLLH